MSQEYIEITERTVSEAIMAACQKLAVPSERLEYEVIDPGFSGNRRKSGKNPCARQTGYGGQC